MSKEVDIRAITWNVGGKTPSKDAVSVLLKSVQGADVIALGTQEEDGKDKNRLHEQLLKSLNAAGDGTYKIVEVANDERTYRKTSAGSLGKSFSDQQTRTTIIVKEPYSFDPKPIVLAVDDKSSVTAPFSQDKNKTLINISGSLVRAEGDGTVTPVMNVSIGSGHMESNAEESRRIHTDSYLAETSTMVKAENFNDLLDEASKVHIVMGDTNERDYLTGGGEVRPGIGNQMAMCGMGFDIDKRPISTMKGVSISEDNPISIKGEVKGQVKKISGITSFEGSYGVVIDNKGQQVYVKSKKSSSRPHVTEGGHLDRVAVATGLNVQNTGYATVADGVAFNSKGKIRYWGSDHAPVVRSVSIDADTSQNAKAANFILARLPDFADRINNLTALVRKIEEVADSGRYEDFEDDEIIAEALSSFKIYDVKGNNADIIKKTFGFDCDVDSVESAVESILEEFDRTLELQDQVDEVYDALNNIKKIDGSLDNEIERWMLDTFNSVSNVNHLNNKAAIENPIDNPGISSYEAAFSNLCENVPTFSEPEKLDGSVDDSDYDIDEQELLDKIGSLSDSVYMNIIKPIELEIKSVSRDLKGLISKSKKDELNEKLNGLESALKAANKYEGESLSLGAELKDNMSAYSSNKGLSAREVNKRFTEKTRDFVADTIPKVQKNIVKKESKIITGIKKFFNAISRAFTGKNAFVIYEDNEAGLNTIKGKLEEHLNNYGALEPETPGEPAGPQPDDIVEPESSTPGMSLDSIEALEPDEVMPSTPATPEGLEASDIEDLDPDDIMPSIPATPEGLGPYNVEDLDPDDIMPSTPATPEAIVAPAAATAPSAPVVDSVEASQEPTPAPISRPHMDYDEAKVPEDHVPYSDDISGLIDNFDIKGEGLNSEKNAQEFVDGIFSDSTARAKLYKGTNLVEEDEEYGVLNTKTSAREAFVSYLEERFDSMSECTQSMDDKIMSPKDARVSMDDLFVGDGGKGKKLYQKAVAEERSSVHFRNALIATSCKQYGEQKWDKRLAITTVGPSVTSKVDLADKTIKSLDSTMSDKPKVTNSEGTANTVLFIDTDLEKELSQMRNLLLKTAVKKGFSGVKDVDKVEEKIPSVTRRLISAAQEQPDLNICVSSNSGDSVYKKFSADNEDVLKVLINVTAEDKKAFKDNVVSESNKSAWVCDPEAYRTQATQEISLDGTSAGGNSVKYGSDTNFDLARSQADMARARYAERIDSGMNNRVIVDVSDDVVRLRYTNKEKTEVTLCNGREASDVSMTTKEYADYKKFLKEQQNPSLQMGSMFKKKKTGVDPTSPEAWLAQRRTKNPSIPPLELKGEENIPKLNAEPDKPAATMTGQFSNDVDKMYDGIRDKRKNYNEAKALEEQKIANTAEAPKKDGNTLT